MHLLTPFALFYRRIWQISLLFHILHVCIWWNLYPVSCTWRMKKLLLSGRTSLHRPCGRKYNPACFKFSDSRKGWRVSERHPKIWARDLERGANPTISEPGTGLSPTGGLIMPAQYVKLLVSCNGSFDRPFQKLGGGPWEFTWLFLARLVLCAFFFLSCTNFNLGQNSG